MYVIRMIIQEWKVYVFFETDDPENVDSWKVIANQETFDNLPACWIRDSINGGGLWDLCGI